MYVLGDMVKDNDVNIMKFNIRKVEGIQEPIKFISAAGFAVG